MEDSIIGNSYQPVLERHRRFYLQALAKEKEVKVSSLVESYRQVKPLLHKGVGSPNLDVDTFKYCLDRLPPVIDQVKKILLIQSPKNFAEIGIDPKLCQEVRAVARRRRMLFDQENGVLVALIASVSDVDDLVNILIAYQIEKSKLKEILQDSKDRFLESEDPGYLEIEPQGWPKLKSALGSDWQGRIKAMIGENQEIALSLLAKNQSDFSQTADEWWYEINKQLLLFNLEGIPLYFVSSNLHSLVNIVGGFVAGKQNEIFNHIRDRYPDLNRRWLDVKEGKDLLRVNDLLYYFSKIYFQDFPEELVQKRAWEEGLGIKNASVGGSGLYSGAQLIPVSSIARSTMIDPHLKIANREKLAKSKSLILNVDYPLGFAAYFLLKEILQNFGTPCGIYIIGKAAILSGQVGDIQLPKVVFDEHTGNTFFINNVFNQGFPFEAFRNRILKDQKAISVYGTFLENQEQMAGYTSAGFNIIEMESGPYLTVLAEAILAKGMPERKVLHIDQIPVDLGIINYASDNPLSKETLGAGSLALAGIESTYLAALSVVERIIDLESK